MDIHKVNNSVNLPGHPEKVDAKGQLACPECMSDILEGDKYCQDCGSRISPARARRAVARKSTVHRLKEATELQIICMNCGNRNSASELNCTRCDFQIASSPAARADSSARAGGLRSSCQEDVDKRRFLQSTQTSIKPAARPIDSSSRAVQSHEPISSSKGWDEQRVSVSSTPNRALKSSGESKKSEDALSLLYPLGESGHPLKGDVSAFEHLESEPKRISNGFSLSELVFMVESFIEQVPTPLIFLVSMVVVICFSVKATMDWTKQDQRLKAIDKIAFNAEEDMKSFQLGKAINTLSELEKTEKGDLPPHARAVLNQSLWLRSYKLAREKNYLQAVSDLARVTSNFTAFSDVEEKLEQYRKITATLKGDKKQLAAAPPSISQVETGGLGKFDAIPATTARGELKINPPAVPIDVILPKPRRKQTEESSGSVSSTTVRKKAVIAEISTVQQPEPRPESSSGDLERYNNYLVKFFDNDSSTKKRSSQVEPDSFEEWCKSGRPDG